LQKWRLELSSEGENLIPPTEAASELLAQASEPTVAVAVETPWEVSRAKRNVRIRKWMWFAAGAIALAFVGALITAWVPPPAAPVVDEITQLTDDGVLKSGLFTDERIYFNQGEYTGFTIAEVAIGGGPVSS
jgi:hypothetical protein